jgi:hypothetical protein
MVPYGRRISKTWRAATGSTLTKKVVTESMYVLTGVPSNWQSSSDEHATAKSSQAEAHCGHSTRRRYRTTAVGRSS